MRRLEDGYDVVVIGAGPAGENVTARIVRSGLSCAIVENDLVGGECSYWACMPSKALLRPVQLSAAVGRMPGLSGACIDTPGVFGRRDAFTNHHDDTGQLRWLRRLPADLFRGHGRLTAPRTVTVTEHAGDTVVLRSRHAVVVATGSSAAIPDIPGLQQASPWTSREITNARRAPERLGIIGAGAVACEMAQAYTGLGSRVTMVVRSNRLLPRLEPFAGQLVGTSLTAAGVDIRTFRTISGVKRRDADGIVEVDLDDGSPLVVDELVVATGRRPRTDDIGLDLLDLRPGSYLEVDDTLTVRDGGGGWLYAVGDVNGRNLLTHMGKYQARICGDVIAARVLGRDQTGLVATADRIGAPQVIFTDPQVAAVGLTEAQARRRGSWVDVVADDLGEVAGAAVLADGYAGRAKLVIDAAARTLLGATFVGQDVAELIKAATVAIVAGLTVEQLWHAVPAYPTVSEIWLRLLEQYGL